MDVCQGPGERYSGRVNRGGGSQWLCQCLSVSYKGHGSRGSGVQLGCVCCSGRVIAQSDTCRL